jgi:hypothetical protein
MAKTKISEWSSTAASNTDIDGINIAEGCAPSGINNAIREVMSQVKDLYSGLSGDSISIGGGGTGATTASAARTNLGVAIGTDVQAYDADLAAIAGISDTSGLLKKTAANTWSLDTTTYAPAASPTLTTPTLVGTLEKQIALAGSAIDVATGNYFTKTLSATTTFTVSNVPSSGNVASFILDLTNGGSYTINWWSGIDWVNGVAPELTTSIGRDILGFFTHDGGTNWTGLVLGKDIK